MRRVHEVPQYVYYVRHGSRRNYGPYARLRTARGLAAGLRPVGGELVIEKYALTLVAQYDDTGEEFTPVRPDMQEETSCTNTTTTHTSDLGIASK